MLDEPILESIPKFMHTIEELKRGMEEEEWKDFCEKNSLIRQWRYFLSNDPLTRWGLLKPKGFAGDATLMDFCYQHKSISEFVDSSSDLGKDIYSTIVGSQQPKSAQMRVALIAKEIDAIADDKKEISLASFASGHAREFELVNKKTKNKIQKFLAIDTDGDSLEKIRASAGDMSIEFAKKNALRISLDAYGSFSLVYSLGLFDYLDETFAKKALNNMWSGVEDGGRLIVGNLSENAASIAYCEAIMDWWMITRSLNDMEVLADHIESLGMCANTEIQEHGCFYYLIANKE